MLHLVGPLGFSVNDKAVRRAGLDYWHLVTVRQHESFPACLASIDVPAPILLSAKATQSYINAPFRPGGALVFGKETKGLAPEITAAHADCLYGIPTAEDSVRSLNLANSVSIVLYEALRQVGAF